ncbi:spopl, partial [Symbiodinium sp. CCMP2592]
VAFSAGAQALNSFTVDFSFSVAAVREGERFFKPKILSLCNGRGGFRIQLEAAKLSLLLFSPTQTLVGELAADFDWKERSDVWTRVTCTLES